MVIATVSVVSEVAVEANMMRLVDAAVTLEAKASWGSWEPADRGEGKVGRVGAGRAVGAVGLQRVGVAGDREVAEIVEPVAEPEGELVAALGAEADDRPLKGHLALGFNGVTEEVDHDLLRVVDQ